MPFLFFKTKFGFFDILPQKKAGRMVDLHRSPSCHHRRATSKHHRKHQ
jgi:hypothetical protein